jgi:hypothetical protein
MYLLFFLVGVAKEDDLAIVGRSMDVTGEVTKESPVELLIT